MTCNNFQIRDGILCKPFFQILRGRQNRLDSMQFWQLRIYPFLNILFSACFEIEIQPTSRFLPPPTFRSWYSAYKPWKHTNLVTRILILEFGICILVFRTCISHNSWNTWNAPSLVFRQRFSCAKILQIQRVKF